MFVITPKVLFLLLALCVIYMAFYRRKRVAEPFCPRCGRRNPSHLNRCQACSAPLVRG